MNSQTRVGDAVGTMVMKKALSIQASTASELIKSVPDAPKPATDSNLGKNIDVTA
jgi:hypothetical protein